MKARNGYFAPSRRRCARCSSSRRWTRRTSTSDHQDDLLVFEDGVEQRIETFQEATSPVSMVLVLDSSGSMKRASEQVVAAAAAFVGALRPEDSMGMLMFADKVEVVHAITTNRANSLEALAEYRAEGGTALYDALCDSMLMLKGLKGRRAVVILTDGRDEDNPGTGPGSVRVWDNVLRLIQDQDVTILPGRPRPEDRRLAPQAPGHLLGRRGLLPTGRRSTQGAVRARHREPPPPLHRRLHVHESHARRQVASRRNRTRTAGIRVTSRKGYFAPAK